MDIGGPHMLSALCRPLADDAATGDHDLEHGTGGGRDSTPAAVAKVVQPALQVARVRLARSDGAIGMVGSACPTSPSLRPAGGVWDSPSLRPADKQRPALQKTVDARLALQRSLHADGECLAVCIAGCLDLEGLARSVRASLGDSSEAARARFRGSPDRRVPAAGLAASSTVQTSAAAEFGVGRRAGSSSSSTGAPLPRRSQDVDLGPVESIENFSSGENLVIHLRFSDDKQLFAFRFGTIVVWNLSRPQLHTAKELLRPFLEHPLNPRDVEEEKMEFIIETGRVGRGVDDEAEGTVVGVRDDQIILATSNPFERLAHSYALAQSVRLDVFEITVDRTIEISRSIPETMASSGEVTVDSVDLWKQMGGLLMLRCDVNLHTDILDTPDLFWDEGGFESHYLSCRAYLDVDKRVEILNQRLAVLKDLFDLLQNGLKAKQGTKLEWIVIILIIMCVAVELVQLLHDMLF